MKYFLILSVLLTCSLPTKADYDPQPLYEMIIKADKIVYGNIIDIDDQYFTLKIEGSLTGETGTLKVARFQDWTCAARWTEYKKGQRLFLFLIFLDGKLVTMSGGNEGELPIMDNSIYINGLSVPIQPPPPPPGITLNNSSIFFDATKHNIYNDKYYGVEWNLWDFLEIVKFTRSCFDFTYGKHQVITSWNVQCASPEIERMCNKSKIITWIYDQARSEY